MIWFVNLTGIKLKINSVEMSVTEDLKGSNNMDSFIK